MKFFLLRLLQILYNDLSPMENHHVAASFVLLWQEKHNFLSHMQRKTRDMLRDLVVQIVLCTDMKQHFATVAQFLGKLATVAVGRSVDDDGESRGSDPQSSQRPGIRKSSSVGKTERPIAISSSRERSVGSSGGLAIDASALLNRPPSIRRPGIRTSGSVGKTEGPNSIIRSECNIPNASGGHVIDASLNQGNRDNPRQLPRLDDVTLLDDELRMLTWKVSQRVGEELFCLFGSGRLGRVTQAELPLGSVAFAQREL